MRDIITYSGNEDLITLVKEKGFFILRNFFNPSVIQELKKSLSAILDTDEAKRDHDKKPVTINENGFTSDFTELMHTIQFPAFKDELLAECILKTLDFEPIKKMLQAVAGPEIRMRVDLVRRSTGLNDTFDEIQLPHVWHKDTPGELTFGFFIDDMQEPDSGGTAVIPSTQWSHFNPIWDFMLGPKPYTSKELYLGSGPAFFPEEYASVADSNKKLSAYFKENAREILGGPGDLYFFVNNVFHGRWPNKSGKKLMLVRFGGFSSAFPFLDNLPTPKAEHRFAKELENLYGPKPKIPWNDDILMCNMIDHPREIDIFEKAVTEKQLLLKKFLDNTTSLKI